jgi:transglutaminase-like putative cysteine protease
MRRGAFLLAGLAALLAGHVRAQETEVVIEKAHREIWIESTGKYVDESEIVTRLVTERGARAAAQVPIPFSESLQTLEILEAYVITPAGERMDVNPSAIITQGAPVALNAPIFTDLKVRIVVFPQPQPGGKIGLKVRLTQEKPLISGQFMYNQIFPRSSVTREQVVHVSAPLDYAVRADSRGLVGGRVDGEKFRQHWEWRFKNDTPHRPEPFEVAELETAAYLALSSFQDWPELAAKYRESAAPKVVVTPAVQALADEITRGLTDRRAQARAIHHWAARNVRYVSLSLGLGSIVPRDAQAILDTKYGDCKDKTVLLEALLKAKGIESQPLLVNGLPRYILPEAAALGAFNHAITYLPEFDTYVDATSATNSFGTIPSALLGKPALNVVTGKIHKIPTGTAADDAVINRVKLVVAEDGTVRASSEVWPEGQMESRLRERLRNVKPGEEDRVLTQWLGEGNQRGKGRISNPNPLDLNERFNLKAEYEMPGAVTLQSPGAFAIPRGLTFAPIATAVSIGNLMGPRRTSFRCSSTRREEHYDISLPPTVKIAAIPKDVTYADRHSSFEARYRQEGDRVLVSRKLVRERETEVCPPDLWEESEKLKAAIERDARAQVLIR